MKTLFIVLLLLLIPAFGAKADTVYVSGYGNFEMYNENGKPSMIDETFSVSYYLDTVTFATTDLTATFSGDLGPFTLFYDNDVIDWTDPGGDYAQIDPGNFFSTGFYPKPGTYDGLMDIECRTCVLNHVNDNDDYFGGIVTVAEIPEPGTFSFSLAGILGLGLLGGVTRSSRNSHANGS
jgi:hypothetical protein